MTPNRPAIGVYEPLWPEGKVPLAKGTAEGDVPTLKFFFATAKPTGSMVVVCPGGGYQHLAPHEADPVALWLNEAGIHAAVLRYRIAPAYQHPAPLLDVSRAIRRIRANAGAWFIDPDRIGVLGFSAGGHLASTVSTHFDDGDPAAADPVDRASSRPDASILLYPVITLNPPSAHTGSRKNLIGPDAPQSLVDELSNDRHVTARTPPTFIFHTVADQAVPVENALLYASALRKAGVPFEMHLYENGQHGVGLARGDRYQPALNTWPDRCVDWLRGRGF
jgi:acetyl esterase/lipase